MVRGNHGDGGADVTAAVLVLEVFDDVVLVVVAEKAWTRSPPWKKKASRWIISRCSIRIVVVVLYRRESEERQWHRDMMAGGCALDLA
jgi:hypothetical protein